MRIIYLHQYFNTPEMPGGNRSFQMARRFVEWGHEVEMITSLREGDDMNRRDWFTTEEAGIRVHWLPVRAGNAVGFRERIMGFCKFAWKASKRAAEIDGDIIFATSTPLTIAIPAIYAQRKRKLPMVFEVRDVWPEAPIQMGVLKNPLLIAAARRLERAAYRHSKAIVALTPGMKDGVVKSGVPESKVTVIPNSSDLDMFSPEIDGSEIRKRFGLEENFVFLYFGTHGKANGLDFVLDAAAELQRRGDEKIAFILHGRGMERDNLKRRAERENLRNVVFSETLPRKRDLAKLVACADVTMTIYKNVPILYTCSPNKMFDSFAAGKPVLTNMPGWLQELVDENQAGVFVRPDDVKEFADTAQRLSSDPGLCETLGRNARRLAEERFARDILARELESVLVKAYYGKGNEKAVVAERG